MNRNKAGYQPLPKITKELLSHKLYPRLRYIVSNQFCDTNTGDIVL